MAKFNVDDGDAVALRRKAGIAITLINQSAVDVYMSREPAQLNASETRRGGRAVAGSDVSGRAVVSRGLEDFDRSDSVKSLAAKKGEEKKQ
jgi:hypothetical protein